MDAVEVIAGDRPHSDAINGQSSSFNFIFCTNGVNGQEKQNPQVMLMKRNKSSTKQTSKLREKTGSAGGICKLSLLLRVLFKACRAGRVVRFQPLQLQHHTWGYREPDTCVEADFPIQFLTHTGLGDILVLVDEFLLEAQRQGVVIKEEANYRFRGGNSVLVTDHSGTLVEDWLEENFPFCQLRLNVGTNGEVELTPHVGDDHHVFEGFLPT